MVWGKQKSTTSIQRQTNSPQHGIVVTRAADLTPQKLSRVWNGRFVLGKIGFMAGVPGGGQGQAPTIMAAKGSSGGDSPSGGSGPHRPDRIYISAVILEAAQIQPS